MLVCLIPTTIGGLVSAIGISGIDRLTRHNMLATSGRAVEAAGDVDVLLLDKTGTITLGNLLTNAGHHTPPGTAIHLTASINAAGDLEIHVRDEGPGLAEPQRVFDRFHRGEASRLGGLGLGLSIVRGLIRGLGGSVEARDAPGGGADFTLKVPVRTARKIPAETHEPHLGH